MMRVKFATLTIICLLLVPIDSRISAQTTHSKSPAGGGWAALETGGKVLRLFQTKAGPRTPEVAVLKLPQASFETFEKDPTAYVRNNNIFPGKKITKVLRCNSEEAMKAAGAGAGDPVVVIMHTICKGEYTYLVGAKMDAGQ